MGAGAGQTCHRMVKDVALGMAGELYETMMSDNRWYASWKESHPGMGALGLERTFIRKNWGALVPQARATLAGMLRSPIDESLKEKIHEALILDRILPQGKAVSGVRS